MTARLYIVHNLRTDKRSLVKANNRNSAASFIARGDYAVKLADQFEIAKLSSEGMKIQDATLGVYNLPEEQL